MYTKKFLPDSNLRGIKTLSSLLHINNNKLTIKIKKKNPSCESALKGGSLDTEHRQAILGRGHPYFGLSYFHIMKPVNTTRL